MSTVTEIKAAIATLSLKERIELERWLHAGPAIPEQPSDLNPEEDTPELEAELLKAANGPFAPFDPAELRAIGERIVRKHRAAHTA